MIFYIWDNKTQIDHVKHFLKNHTVFILPLSVIFYIWDNKTDWPCQILKKNNIQYLCYHFLWYFTFGTIKHRLTMSNIKKTTVYSIYTTIICDILYFSLKQYYCHKSSYSAVNRYNMRTLGSRKYCRKLWLESSKCCIFYKWTVSSLILKSNLNIYKNQIYKSITIKFINL